MPCNYPARGRQNLTTGESSYYGHIQVARGAIPPLPPNTKEYPLPCGKCTGCKLEYSRQWAVRITHEAQLHEKTSFVTLTYRDEELPKTRTRTKTRTRDGSLSKRDLVLFTKRLNAQTKYRFGNGIKYYACGEYGEKTHRPHYHIAIFGEDFSDDRQFWKNAKSGHKLWRSSRLEKLWPHGDADIGELTFESAAYIARYIMKKITGTKSHEHYRRTDDNGHDYWLTPEFNVMSRNPAIGREWLLRYKSSVYPHDHVVTRGHTAKPPRYYDKLLEALAPHEHEIIKKQRQSADRNPENETPARLDAREAVTRARLNQHRRTLE